MILDVNKPKNIILLMTDQLRSDYVGYSGKGNMNTPNIDRIAEGIAFTNCITASPVCTPARSALLTGKYPHQIGMLEMSGDLSLQHPTYPQALQKKGYATYGIGKFHWLQGWRFNTPKGKGHNLVALRDEIKKFGFDHIFEVSGKKLCVQNYCDYAQHLEGHGLLEDYREHAKRGGLNHKIAQKQKVSMESFPFPEEHYADIVIGSKVVESIENREKDQPFFLFGSFVGPHPPYDPPASYLEHIPYEEVDDFIVGERGPLPDETKQQLYQLRRCYKAMISIIDEQIGRILNKLEEEGIMDETVILFISDHGEMMGDHGRSLKWSSHWTSAGIPAVIRHPDYLDARTNTSVVELIDIAATILDLAGIDPQEALSRDWPIFNNIVPCRSLLPIITGAEERIREYGFAECYNKHQIFDNWHMIQSESWKYVRHMNYEAPGGAWEELFDLEADPDECNNLIADPSFSDVVEWCRRRREFVIDTTPSAQLRWAPIMHEDENV